VLLEKLFGDIVMKTQNHEDYSHYKLNKCLEKLEERLFGIQREKGRGRSRYLYNTFQVRLKKAKEKKQKSMIIYENRLNILVRFADNNCKSWKDFLRKHNDLPKPLPKFEEKVNVPNISVNPLPYWNIPLSFVQYVYLS
jgi:hypothetical protein